MWRKGESVEEYVLNLAAEHGVTDEPDAYDRMATVLTGLSGDDVVLDRVERLLVALKKKGVLEGREMLLLQAEYLAAKRG